MCDRFINAVRKANWCKSFMILLTVIYQAGINRESGKQADTNRGRRKTTMNTATKTNVSDFQFPINQWVDICSLDSAQLDAYSEAKKRCGFKMEWQHTIVNSKEIMMVKITRTQSL